MSGGYLFAVLFAYPRVPNLLVAGYHRYVSCPSDFFFKMPPSLISTEIVDPTLQLAHNFVHSVLFRAMYTYTKGAAGRAQVQIQPPRVLDGVLCPGLGPDDFSLRVWVLQNWTRSTSVAYSIAPSLNMHKSINLKSPKVC